MGRSVKVSRGQRSHSPPIPLLVEVTVLGEVTFFYQPILVVLVSSSGCVYCRDIYPITLTDFAAKIIINMDLLMLLLCIVGVDSYN